MKITKIEEMDGGGKYGKYAVWFEPNWFERLLGRQKIRIIYKKIDEYFYGNGGVYINDKGEKLGNYSSIGSAIDNYILSKDF